MDKTNLGKNHNQTYSQIMTNILTLCSNIGVRFSEDTCLFLKGEGPRPMYKDDVNEKKPDSKCIHCFIKIPTGNLECEWCHESKHLYNNLYNGYLAKRIASVIDLIDPIDLPKALRVILRDVYKELDNKMDQDED